MFPFRLRRIDMRIMTIMMHAVDVYRSQPRYKISTTFGMYVRVFTMSVAVKSTTVKHRYVQAS